MLKHFKNLMCMLFLIVIISACASTHAPSGFLEDYSSLREGIYFKQESISRTADFTKYDTVKIDPINMYYMEGKENYTREELDKLKDNFQNELKEAFKNKGIRVLTEGQIPNEKTIVLDVAVTKIKSPQRTLNAVTSVLVFVPVTAGSAAFETRMKDGATGEVLVEVAEKHSGGGTDTKSLAVGSYTKFTHAESAFEIWAKKLAEIVRK